MGKRKHYPSQIHRKFQKLPETSTHQNTQTKLEAADLIEEHWDEDATFKSISELDNAPSAKTIRRAWEDYFGPIDDERTFTELKEEFGSTDAYFEAKENGRLNDEGQPKPDSDSVIEANGGPLSDREQRIGKFYYELGFEDGLEAKESELEE